MSKLNFTTKLHKLAFKDEKLRPELCNIYFKDDYVYVSDAHVAIKQHLRHHGVESYHNLNGKALSGFIFNFIRKNFTKVVAEVEHLSCYNRKGDKITVPYMIPEIDVAKKIEDVWPQGEGKAVDAIGVNPKYLHQLCKGMKVSDVYQLKLKFFGKNKPIMVTANDIGDQTGILMPVMIFDNE